MEQKKIPKVIHQIWIGHLPQPETLLRTWKEKNPDYEYILWNEERISQELHNPICSSQVQIIPEINGKADILRWEILYEYGGFFFDADSVCLNPLLEEFRDIPGNGFSCFENEVMREGLIACGSMGFIPKHPVIGKILESIKNQENQHLLTTTRAWYSVGPGVLTRVVNECPDEEKITIFPSHMFLPRHHTGLTYSGHEQIYAYQFWGTNDRSYNSVDKMVVPPEFTQEPLRWVSVIVSSLNTPAEFIFDCLQSIQQQTGYFGIELIWVNDGSDNENTEILKNHLNVFQQTSRFLKCKYLENQQTQGCRRSLRLAVENCSYDLIFKMDSDDIMLPHRIQTQMRFMDENPLIPVCGGQMSFFTDDKIIKTTQHPTEITWETFVQAKQKPTWFMNHPTLCFRKKHLLDIGNYPDTPISKEHPERNMMDDYQIELKLLKKYGRLCNLSETLLKYRVHPNQMTQHFDDTNPSLILWREQIINDILNEDVSTGITYELKENTVGQNHENTPPVVTPLHLKGAWQPLPSSLLKANEVDDLFVQMHKETHIKSEPEILIKETTPFLATGEYIPSHFVFI